MSSIKLTSIEVQGSSLDVTVSAEGWFYAEVNETKLCDTTLTGLKAKIQYATRRSKVKVDVPFTAVIDGQIQNVTGTGIHGGSGHITVRYADGKTGTLTKYGQTNLRRLTLSETMELQELIDAKNASYRALEAFFQSNRVDIGKMVKDAVSALMPKETT